MLGYDYEIIYKKGHENIVEDALACQFEESTLLTISLPILEWIEEVRKECDPDLNRNAIKHRDNHKHKYAVEIILHFINIKY